MKYSLPDSADDLLIKDGKLLMRSLSIYEVLRRFGHIIRLTPFRFEDFTGALLADEQSPLIAEVHLQILKTLMREDRQQQTWLGPPDLRDSVNIYLHLADHSNWPAALRLYLSADTKENSYILEKLAQDEFKNYPFNVDLQLKLDVIEHLCDQFLSSNLAREEIQRNINGSNSNDKHDTICRSCSKANGDLLPCTKCPAVYHLKCSDPPLENYPDLESGDEAYTCAICRSNHIKGVSDCIDTNEQSGNLKRHDALGSDKLERRYLFLIRRIFVVDENEEDVRYYTTHDQFNLIVENLDEKRYEKSLIDNLTEQRDEIERQMKITQDLYQSLLADHKKEDGSYSKFLGQDGTHNRYINHYSTNNLAVGKNQHSDRDINRSLGNKFCMSNLNSFKYNGAINANLTTVTVTIKSTILRFEAMLPQTFIHPCWQSHRAAWLKLINYGRGPMDHAIALSQLEASIKPVLFKAAWFDCVGFSHLFRSTFAEREELKKTDRQPRGFERREWFSQDFELSYRLGTMVKFSPKLKPVKHQVWKQKGEEYRLTGLNAWYWRSCTFKSKMKPPKPKGTIKEPKIPEKSTIKKTVLVKPKLPPCHDFQTKRTKKRSLLILPDLELHKLARSGGMRETKSFSYTAKQNNYVWPYGMTPRPTFRTSWLYRNQIIDTIQDVALQLKVFYASLRWDDLQVKPPAAGHNVITTDDSTVTIELLKKRDRLPYLNHSEYLIKKIISPIERPTKYKKIGTKKVTPSARSGLRARRQVEEEEVKGPITEEVWVSEDQLELWEIRQFDERIERQNQMLRERAMREEAERRRKIEEEKRRKAEQERRRRAEEEAKRARLSVTPTTPQTPTIIANNLSQPRSLPTTPVLRYFRTEQGQIIRLPASYLQRGTPLILRHVGPGPNQTNTYIIRPQISPVTTNVAPSNIATPIVSSANTITPVSTTASTITSINITNTTTVAPANTANSTATNSSTTNVAPSATTISSAPTSATVTTSPMVTSNSTLTTSSSVTTSSTIATASIASIANPAAIITSTTTANSTAATAISSAVSSVTASSTPTLIPMASTIPDAATSTTAASINTTDIKNSATTVSTYTASPVTTTACTPTSLSEQVAEKSSPAAPSEAPPPPPTTTTATTITTASTTTSNSDEQVENKLDAAAIPKASEPAQSVGTVKVELAHDQHAPAT